jgi:hypothetical protein
MGQQEDEHLVAPHPTGSAQLLFLRSCSCSCSVVLTLGSKFEVGDGSVFFGLLGALMNGCEYGQSFWVV